MGIQFKQQTNKYRNQPVIIDGIRFDSKREASRYSQLRILEKVGDITDLQCHPRYRLEVRGIRIATYVPDFQYRRDGELVVEDVKSPPTKTPQYRMKARLMEALHGIRVIEVE